ncbi:MAG: HisA/HisF-related TIM barrel protein, partial [Gammaproteobacteria bacterium]|nr:HisA/HisF-related TIM barrel protein [Gammaproteobacteria bacterium]
LPLRRMARAAVPISVIASGGAGKPAYLRDVLTEGKADGALVASMVHYGTYRVSELKDFLHDEGIKVRLSW